MQRNFLTVFKVYLHSACTTYIPSVIKKPLYWFCWPFNTPHHSPVFIRVPLLWPRLSLCTCACNSGSWRSLWGSSHAETDRRSEGGRETKSMSLHPPTLGNEVTSEGMSSWSLRIHLKNTCTIVSEHIWSSSDDDVLFSEIQVILTHTLITFSFFTFLTF